MAKWYLKVEIYSLQILTTKSSILSDIENIKVLEFFVENLILKLYFHLPLNLVRMSSRIYSEDNVLF